MIIVWRAPLRSNEGLRRRRWLIALLAALACLAPAFVRAADLRLTLVASGLRRPVDLCSAPGDPRLFVVEQPGRIRIVENGKVKTPPFLDLTGLVSRANEQGLLGLAFHPRYAENGLLFVNYTDTDGATQVVRYKVRADRQAADPASARRILTVEQPYSNHNGGQVLFGPDGMLYIPLGDGGSGGDPHGNGQNLRTLLGKILRIDVDRGSPYAIPADNPFATRKDARPEIWAYGVRNPWRIAFDPTGTKLFVADVGQNEWEEVNVAPARRGGINYGWKAYEGTHVYDRNTRIDPAPWVPILDYSHKGACCVIGGHVYRGSVPSLRGLYFYADECGGWIESFRERNLRSTELTHWTLNQHLTPTAFGEDAKGELYVLDLGGKVFRITGAR